MKHMPRISARHLLSNLWQITYRMRFILPERKCCLQLPSTRAYRESVTTVLAAMVMMKCKESLRVKNYGVAVHFPLRRPGA